MALERLRADRRSRPAAAVLAVVLSACSAATATTRAAPSAPAPAARTCSSDTAAPGEPGAPVLRTTRDGCTLQVATSYRCAARDDPLVVVRGAPPRRYLGGRFAVRVPAVPETAAFLGVADGRSLYREHGSDGRLFSIADGVVERWLELPTRAPAPSPSAFVLGDSIALGSADDIVRELPAWSTTVDAVVGRPSADGVPIAQALPERPTGAVVELGTNDQDAAAFAANARAILRALADVPLVVWVMPHAAFAATPQVRREIGRLVGRTSNAVAIDWDAAVPLDALSTDGVHLLPDRVGVFATFLARPLRAWRLAAIGRGDAACAAPLQPGANAGV